METHYLVNGTQTKRHVFQVGDDVVINCLIKAMPVPTVSWNYGQQRINATARTKVCFGCVWQHRLKKIKV